MDFKASLDKAKARASKLMKDPQATEIFLEEAYRKAKGRKTALSSIKDDLSTLLKMLRAWVRGEYRQVPWRVIVSGMAGLIYFVNPLDLIPDFIAGAGLFDDITVLGMVFAAIKADLEKFRMWLEDQDKDKVEKK
jgi:uncharacterized membrane protein YkvA (DUF1232 family)